MKSHGILSRYMRPGYSRGQYVQAAKSGNINQGPDEYAKKKENFFKKDNLALYKRNRLPTEDDPLAYTTEKSDISDFDPAKIKDGTQLLIEYDTETFEPIFGTGLDGSISPKDAPFLFYSAPGDYRRILDQTDYDDMIFGKPFADDVSFADKTKEVLKMGGRGLYGLVKNIPEMTAGAYRFINPFDALGGVGPYDMIYPKDEKQQKQSDNMYYLPWYSDYFKNNYDISPLQTPKGVLGGVLDADESLYKETAVDDRMKSEYQNLMDDYNVLQTYTPDQLRETLEGMDMSEEDMQYYFDLKNAPIEKLEEAKYMSDRSAISHDMPGYLASIAATLPVVAGPLGAAGATANIAVRGNRMSKAINKLRKTKKAKAIDASIGLGVPQFTSEYAIRDFTEDDSIYPDQTVPYQAE